MTKPKGFVMLVVALTIGLGLSEAMVRLAAPQRSTPMLPALGEPLHIGDPRYGWKLQPGYEGGFAYGTTVSVSTQGLRDVEYGPKVPGEIRVLSLGDSYAFGWGVEFEESYVKILEHSLRDEFPTSSLSVINGAVTGYTTRQEILALADLARAFEPDLVMVTFAATNDIYENHVFEQRLQQGISTPLGPISRHSHVARLVLRAIWPARFFLSNRSDANVAETLSLLDTLRADAESRGIEVLMVMMPSRAELDPSARFETRIMPAKLLAKPTEVVLAHWVQQSVDYVDLRPALASALQQGNIFLEGDPHPNAGGHRAIARAVFDRIRPMVADFLQEAPLP